MRPRLAMRSSLPGPVGRIVRLVPIDDPPPRQLGFMLLDVADALFDPLSADELEGWE